MRSTCEKTLDRCCRTVAPTFYWKVWNQSCFPSLLGSLRRVVPVFWISTLPGLCWSGPESQRLGILSSHQLGEAWLHHAHFSLSNTELKFAGITSRSFEWMAAWLTLKATAASLLLLIPRSQLCHTFLLSEAATPGSGPPQERRWTTIFGTVSCMIFEVPLPIAKLNECCGL